MRKTHYQEPGKPVLCGSDKPHINAVHLACQSYAVQATHIKAHVTCKLCLQMLYKHFAYKE